MRTLCFLPIAFLLTACSSGEGDCPGGECYPPDCPDRDCPAGSVCADGACVQEICLGVRCPDGAACAGGQCHPKDCTARNCPGLGEVCVGEECIPADCVGVTCDPGGRCAQGACYPINCQSDTCPGPGDVCVGEVCTERTCLGVTCPAGQACAGGYCYPKDCDQKICSAEGMLCANRECQQPRCVGVFCRSGQSCIDGWCEQPCTPESDDQFCARLGYDCDPVTAADNCGNQRTVDCGSCTPPDTCTGNLCGCTEVTCMDLGAECGLIFDECESWVYCGDCTLPETCNDATNICECDPHATSACYLGNRWWYNCNRVRQELRETCAYKCENDTCIPCLSCTYLDLTCAESPAGCVSGDCLSECRRNGDVSGGDLCTEWYLADDCGARTLCCGPTACVGCR